MANNPTGIDYVHSCFYRRNCYIFQWNYLYHIPTPHLQTKLACSLTCTYYTGFRWYSDRNGYQVNLLYNTDDYLEERLLQIRTGVQRNYLLRCSVHVSLVKRIFLRSNNVGVLQKILPCNKEMLCSLLACRLANTNSFSTG